jgi:hypothetical protein
LNESSYHGYSVPFVDKLGTRKKWLNLEQNNFLLLDLLTKTSMKMVRRMVSSGLLRRVALVRTDVSKELSASIIKVTRIGELGTTVAVTCKGRTL